MPQLLRYHSPTQSVKPPGEHILVFDGDCGFCRACAEFIRKHARARVVLVPFAELSQHDILNSLDDADILASAHYVTPDGREYHGGESVTRVLRLLPLGAAFAILDLWGVHVLRELGYALIAQNRRHLSNTIRRLHRFRRFLVLSYWYGF